MSHRNHDAADDEASLSSDESSVDPFLDHDQDQDHHLSLTRNRYRRPLNPKHSNGLSRPPEISLEIPTTDLGARSLRKRARDVDRLLTTSITAANNESTARPRRLRRRQQTTTPAAPLRRSSRSSRIPLRWQPSKEVGAAPDMHYDTDDSYQEKEPFNEKVLQKTTPRCIVSNGSSLSNTSVKTRSNDQNQHSSTTRTRQCSSSKEITTLIEQDHEDAAEKSNQLTALATDQHPSIGPQPRGDWIPLSHRGHMSDYIGVQRKYESAFVHLAWSDSIATVRSSIQDILQQNNMNQDKEEGEESDQEVAQEQDRLQQLFADYEIKALQERKNRNKKQNLEKKKKEDFSSDLLSMPVLWEKDHPTCDMDLDEENTPKVLIANTMDLSTPDPPNYPHCIQCDEIEWDPLDIGDAASNENPEVPEKSRRRSGRSQEMHLQRKASLWMLKELKHKLDFIIQYNQGPAWEKEKNVQEEEEDDESLEQAEEHHANQEQPSREKLSRKATRQAKDGAMASHKAKKIAWESSEAKRMPLFPNEGKNAVLPTMDIDSILLDYKWLRHEKILTLPSLPLHPSLETLKELILSVLENQPEAGADEEDLEEQRNYIRAIRTYTGKADQERIEKLKHEEERENRVRELEHRKRSKKPTQEDLEWEQLENRPVLFTTPSGRNHQSHCPPGNDCPLCHGEAELYHDATDLTTTDTVSVFLPGFSQVADGTSYGEDDEKTSENGKRTSRIHQKLAQKQRFVGILKELVFRLDFVEQYNSGWIFTESTNKRRK